MMKLSFLNKTLFLVNILFAVALLLSTFSPQIEPESAKFVFLFGLAYPAFLLMNILFVLYWIKKKKIQLILSLSIILFGYSNMKTLFATNLTNHKTSKPELTIMSFNIRLFNQYDWIKTEGINDSIFKYLQDESPDIVAFQEFINHTKSDLNYINQMKELGYPYYSLEPKTLAAKAKKYFGLATFSKHRISSSGVAYQNFTPKGYPSKTVSIFSDIQINKNIVRVYNTHLKSLSFGKNDYEFVENITGNTKDDAVKKSKGIASKVLQAAYKRANEIKAINQHVSESPYPVILLGDFNEPPYTYSYKQATTNLSDSFLEHGFGLGTTYDGISTIPGLRLDFILHSPALICTSFEIGMSGLSDHRPLIAGFSFSE